MAMANSAAANNNNACRALLLAVRGRTLREMRALFALVVAVFSLWSRLRRPAH